MTGQNMTFNDRVRFVTVVVVALSVTTALMVRLGELSYLLFAAVAIVEFLLIVETTASNSREAAWVSRLRWLVAASLILITLLVTQYLLMTVSMEPF